MTQKDRFIEALAHFLADDQDKKLPMIKVETERKGIVSSKLPRLAHDWMRLAALVGLTGGHTFEDAHITLRRLLCEEEDRL